MSTAVAKAKSTEMSADLMDDMLDDAGVGTTFDANDLLIPFIRLAQSLSPHVNKKKPEYIEGLEVGDAYNNVTGEFWKGEEGFKVIPCYQTTKYLEFVPRESGGGMVGEISPNDPILQQTRREGGKETLPNGNELVKTDQHFCLLLGDEGMFQPVVVDMKSTQLKVSRRWKTQITMRKIKHPKTGRLMTPPLFACVWHLKAVEENNDKGDFYNWTVNFDSMVSDPDLYNEAKVFRQQIEGGAVKTQEDKPAPDMNGSAGAHLNDGLGEDIPF